MPHKPLSFGILIFIAVLAHASSEVYAPSLPSMSQYFQTSTSMVQWTLAIYMMGTSLAQLVYGPLSEVYGRKPILIVGVSIFSLGTLIALMATSIEMLLLGRLIQGVGVGSPAGLWRSIFKDMFQGPAIAKYASYLTIVVGIVFPLAPALGGVLETYFSWHASFWFMLIYGITLLIVLLTLFQETNTQLNPNITLRSVLEGYGALLKNFLFLGATSFTFLMFGALFATVATAPVLFIQLGGMSPILFGWTTCLTATVCMSFSGWLNGRFVECKGPDTMLSVGLVSLFISGLFFLGGYLIQGTPHLSTMIIGLMFLYFSAGFVFTNAFAKAFTPLKKNIGFAGSLYGFIQMAGGAMLGALTSYLPNSTPIPLSFTLMGCGVGGGLMLKWLKPYSK